MGQSYVAFVSSCDGFAAFLQETADHTAVDHFQGISQFWQPGLPTHLPESWKERVRTDPEVAAYDRKMAKATDNFTRDQLRRDRQNAVKRLEQASLKLYRSEVFKEKQRERLYGHKALDNTPDVIAEIIPEKGRIAQTMMSKSASTFETKLEAMRDLQVLLAGDWSVYHRPGEEPKDGCCPYCTKELKQ